MPLHGYNNEHFNSYQITRFKYRTKIFLYNVGLNKITGILFVMFCLEILLRTDCANPCSLRGFLRYLKMTFNTILGNLPIFIFNKLPKPVPKINCLMLSNLIQLRGFGNMFNIVVVLLKHVL